MVLVPLIPLFKPFLNLPNSFSDYVSHSYFVFMSLTRCLYSNIFPVVVSIIALNLVPFPMGQFCVISCVINAFSAIAHALVGYLCMGMHLDHFDDIPL